MKTNFRLGTLASLWLVTVCLPAAPLPDRWVWTFGWNLNQDADVEEISRMFETAGKHGLNGAVISFGLDSLCKKTPDFFRRLEAVKQAGERNHLELIPSLFSIGYGGGYLTHNRQLAEGLPVSNAAFVVRGPEARFVPDAATRLVNGGFETYTGQRFKGYGFHDQPGEISFVDTNMFHSGRAAIRMENFGLNPHGHGRVSQEVTVIPHRCYRVSLWVKTEGLAPLNAFRVTCLTDRQELAPRTFDLSATMDWRQLTFIFNSGDHAKVRLYAGLWEGRQGRVWIDDWSVEEIGPLNVLHRPGTPVTVQAEDGIRYEEGRDYAPLVDKDFSLWRTDRPAPVLKLPPGTRLREGQTVRVSWYHPQVIHDSQVTVCMAEPELAGIEDHEALLLAQHLKPRSILLNLDEVRMGGTCQACAGRDMARLMGETVARQSATLRRHSPGARIYVWSDMFDPNHNARPNYYLVKGDYTGSWKHLPKDTVVAIWGGGPREKSVRFFAGEGFPMLLACYYDADDLKDVRGWLDLARATPGARGLMYTPWQKKYGLLGAFGDLLTQPAGRK